MYKLGTGLLTGSCLPAGDGKERCGHYMHKYGKTDVINIFKDKKTPNTCPVLMFSTSWFSSFSYRMYLNKASVWTSST